MTVLGLRASSQEIRYAILRKDDFGSISFVNKSGENRLKYPVNISPIEKKLQWVKDEIDRVLRQNQSIDKMVIKVNEYGQESAAKRETTYIDAVFLLCAAQHGLPVERKLNSQISSTAACAKELAEQRVGRTDQYWNNTMADAVLSAFWEVR